MMRGHHIRVRELPQVIQDALNSAGFHRDDIQVHVQEEFEPRPPSADGRKGFVAACNLSTNDFKITWGSWGGSNTFTQTVDDVEGSMPIPKDGAFITGLSNAGPGLPGFARIYVSPANVNPTLLPPVHNVTEKEAKILAIFRSLKSGYRKEYLGRMGVVDAEVDSLVERKYLSRNKAGATSITTEGRNAAAANYY